MARKALIESCKRKKRDVQKALAAGKAPKRRTQRYNRCRLCGRQHGYMGDFEMCRICFREKASDGLIPGISKSSW